MDKDTLEALAGELESALMSLKGVKHWAGFDPGDGILLATLAKLSQTGAPVRPSDLARQLQVTGAAITHHLNSLEKRGYVVRKASADDRRAVHLSLSEKGAQALHDMRQRRRQGLMGMLEFLGEDDSRQLIALLSRTAEYMRGSAPQ